ncbi:MAG: hypothetical protein C4287_23215 [Leptolyngbya sp. ERB_1_2]
MRAHYPITPGYKDRETSAAAAHSLKPKAGIIRQRVIAAYLVFGPQTADEVARRLGVSILTVRPRVSELVNLGRLIDTGVRRANESGHKAKVYALK